LDRIFDLNWFVAFFRPQRIYKQSNRFYHYNMIRSSRKPASFHSLRWSTQPDDYNLRIFTGQRSPPNREILPVFPNYPKQAPALSYATVVKYLGKAGSATGMLTQLLLVVEIAGRDPESSDKISTSISPVKEQHMRATFFGGLATGFLLLSFVSQPDLSLAKAFQDNAPEAAKAAEGPKPEFPPLAKVLEGFTEVKVQDGATPFFRLWTNNEGRILGELPPNFSAPTTRHFIAPTVSGGEQFAGLQSGDYYVYWKKYGKQVALVQENLSIKGSDEESKSSVKRIFTDQVMVSVPILAMERGKGPVIDLNFLLVSNANVFLGPGYRPQSNLVDVKKVKAFPDNIEIAYEVPMSNGQLKTLHYSISKIEGSPNYKPRMADQRIGYFTTSYSDFGKYDRDGTKVIYINRWHIEKRDPSLKMSPPKKPIVFYIEHTTPVRYRRWVREGILAWNKAYEKIGIVDAIEVRQQDKPTNQYMDLDPEDVRYNFVRWLNNDVSTAIGPSRVNPLTGEILDADIILTDGWIRAFEDQFSNLMPKIAMDGMTPETLAWLERYPHWDPRVRLAEPSARDFIQQQLAYQASLKVTREKQHEFETKLMGTSPWDGIVGRTSQVNGACMAAEGRGFDVALMRMSASMIREGMLDDQPASADGEKKNGNAEEKEKEKEQILDGMPESFIGPLLADLVAHEVGHTLGLRHNFKASSIYTIAEMNSEDVKGKKPLAGSVMDYLPTNFKVKNGEVQGDYAMIGVGPYDFWAIEYGYTTDDKALPKILARCAEPELAFCTDEDTLGPDPLARRYDMGKDPLDFAEDQFALAQMHRERILSDFVKDGDAWERARRGYLMTLGLQARASSMMSNWLGGTFVHRDKKGDPNARKPIEVVPAESQRKALNFVIQTMLFDESFGLNSELLNHLTSDFMAGFEAFFLEEAAWPVHDRIMGLQASTLTQLMNPTVLRRVYDNELRVPADEDSLTLNELLKTITQAVWKELDQPLTGEYSDRKNAISSLRRNLQTEHLQRLFDLASENKGAAAMKPISNLASMTLLNLQEKLATASTQENLDAYSKAHLLDALDRVKKFNDSTYVMNSSSSGGMGGGMFFMMGQSSDEK
jgi:hypothetical protein